MLIKNVPVSVIKQLVKSEVLCNSLSLSVSSEKSPDGDIYFILLNDSSRDLCFRTKSFSFYDPHFRSVLLDFHCILADTILENQPF